jgi:dCTP deaminase
MLGRVEGRSSIGRCGLLIHATAGFIDPGFEGNITLELFNLTNHPIQIYQGQRICQIALEYLSSDCEQGYGEKYDSKYHGQLGVVSSKINEDR